MKFIKNWFVVLLWFSVFSVYSAGAGSSACEGAFEQASQELINQLVSWGFSKEQALKIAVKNESFRSLQDTQFEAVKQQVEWLMTIGFSGKEAFWKSVRSSKRPSFLESRVTKLLFVGNAELTPKKQLELTELKQHIEWLMDVGLSGKEALEVSNDIGSMFYFRRLTPQRKEQLQELGGRVEYVIQRFGISRKKAIYVVSNFNAYYNLVFKLPHLGFTNEQLGQMTELGIFAGNKFQFLGRGKMSIQEKKDKLREVGFTEAEIQRIPVHIMFILWSYQKQSSLAR